MSVWYVKIPADASIPCEELTATVTEVGDQMPTIMKPAFAGGSIVNADSLRAQFGNVVDTKMGVLNRVAAEGSVETFALVRPSETTVPAHAGTYFYYDEMGALKGLPANKRAAALAKSCGLDVESPFPGDVFVGRVRIAPSPMCNIDFRLSDLDSGSPWLRCAPAENAQYKIAMRKYEAAVKEKSVAGGSQPSVDGALADADDGETQWTQTVEDLEVIVKLPEGTGRKDVLVDYPTTKMLRVRLKGIASANPLAELALFDAIRPDECTWTFSCESSGPRVHVTMEKQQPVTWSALEVAR